MRANELPGFMTRPGSLLPEGWTIKNDYQSYLYRGGCCSELLKDGVVVAVCGYDADGRGFSRSVSDDPEVVALLTDLIQTANLIQTAKEQAERQERRREEIAARAQAKEQARRAVLGEPSAPTTPATSAPTTSRDGD